MGQTIFKLLTFSTYEFVDIVGILVSIQLTGGLGAISGNEFTSLLKKLKKLNTSTSFALGTACHCHGIITLFKLAS